MTIGDKKASLIRNDGSNITLNKPITISSTMTDIIQITEPGWYHGSFTYSVNKDGDNVTDTSNVKNTPAIKIKDELTSGKSYGYDVFVAGTGDYIFNLETSVFYGKKLANANITWYKVSPLVKDWLDSTDSESALSANCGRLLKEELDTKSPNTHTHDSLEITEDTRDTATKPSDYTNGFNFVGIKDSTVIGLPDAGTNTTYATVIGFDGWTDSSGIGAVELAITDSGLIYMRKQAHGDSTNSFGEWFKIVTTSDGISWSNVTNKPTAYPPEAHNHDDRYYTQFEVDQKDSTISDAVNSLKSKFDAISTANDHYSTLQWVLNYIMVKDNPGSNAAYKYGGKTFSQILDLNNMGVAQTGIAKVSGSWPYYYGNFGGVYYIPGIAQSCTLRYKPTPDTCTQSSPISYSSNNSVVNVNSSTGDMSYSEVTGNTVDTVITVKSGQYTAQERFIIVENVKLSENENNFLSYWGLTADMYTTSISPNGNYYYTGYKSDTVKFTFNIGDKFKNSTIVNLLKSYKSNVYVKGRISSDNSTVNFTERHIKSISVTDIEKSFLVKPNTELVIDFTGNLGFRPNDYKAEYNQSNNTNEIVSHWCNSWNIEIGFGNTSIITANGNGQ